MRTVDASAERYRIIVLSDGYRVETYNANWEDDQEYCATLDDLRGHVATLRDDGAIRSLKVTYRKVLDPVEFYSATLARPYDKDEELPLSGYVIAQYGLDVTAERLADPAIRFLSIPSCHSDPYGQDHVAKINADALQEIETESNGGDGLGWIGNSLALDLDKEADTAVIEALVGLESYPVVDEEAVSTYEFEEDERLWGEWGQTDALKEVDKLLPLSYPIDEIDLDGDDAPHDTRKLREALREALQTAASEQGRSSDESSEDIAKRFVEGEGGPLSALVALMEAEAIKPEDIDEDDKDKLRDVLAVIAERQAHRSTPPLPGLVLVIHSHSDIDKEAARAALFGGGGDEG